ncbi:hypothetical protein [Staphylococcus aureus]|uniref:hypothetical protein n=1 Tax=Staphylococcus aureus TaxID=1280 RepID=UPI00045084B7|nr:hypothetical protein [Staphylococcus aureus]EXQ55835.1 hypothetical protein V767_00271 [Staphylococcus aureus F36099]
MGPNTEADEKSAYNNVQVGDGPQQREIGFPISTDNASWGGGPNTEKLDSQFQQTMQVAGGAPTQRNWIPNFYRQCKLGWGPQQREIVFPISTDNASWGGTTK